MAPKSAQREIVIDIETTGLDPDEDRIIEIGCVELVNGHRTGRTFQSYINPEGKEIDSEAFEVHGISDDRVANAPTFDEISSDLVEFIGDARLVAHNGKAFDLVFLNRAIMSGNVPVPPFSEARLVDTLVLAKSKHPRGSNSLDALCERYEIDTRKRTKHGALVDAELLADVYYKMIRGERPEISHLEPPPGAMENTIREAADDGSKKEQDDTGLSKDNRVAESDFPGSKERPIDVDIVDLFDDRSGEPHSEVQPRKAVLATRKRDAARLAGKDQVTNRTPSNSSNITPGEGARILGGIHPERPGSAVQSLAAELTARKASTVAAKRKRDPAGVATGFHAAKPTRTSSSKDTLDDDAAKSGGDSSDDFELFRRPIKRRKRPTALSIAKQNRARAAAIMAEKEQAANRTPSSSRAESLGAGARNLRRDRTEQSDSARQPMAAEQATRQASAISTKRKRDPAGVATGFQAAKSSRPSSSKDTLDDDATKSGGDSSDGFEMLGSRIKRQKKPTFNPVTWGEAEARRQNPLQLWRGGPFTSELTDKQKETLHSKKTQERLKVLRGQTEKRMHRQQQLEHDRQTGAEENGGGIEFDPRRQLSRSPRSNGR